MGHDQHPSCHDALSNVLICADLGRYSIANYGESGSIDRAIVYADRHRDSVDCSLVSLVRCTGGDVGFGGRRVGCLVAPFDRARYVLDAGPYGDLCLWRSGCRYLRVSDLRDNVCLCR